MDAAAPPASPPAPPTDVRVVAAVFHGWLGLHFEDAKRMLAACLGIGGIDVAPVRAGVVVSIESMLGLPLGKFLLSPEEAARLVGILGTNGLPEFGRTIREHVRVALTRSTYADNVWPELLSLPLHLFKHGEGDDVDVLQEYDPKGDSTSWAKWLQGKTPLLRVAPFVDSTKLMRTFCFALFCLVVCLNDSWLHSNLYGLHGWFNVLFLHLCTELASSERGPDVHSELKILVKLGLASQHSAVRYTPMGLSLMTAALLRTAPKPSGPSWRATLTLLKVYKDLIQRAAEVVLGSNSAFSMELFDAMCCALGKLPHEMLESLGGVFTPAVLTKMLTITSGLVGSAPTQPTYYPVKAVCELFRATTPLPRNLDFAEEVFKSGLLEACTELVSVSASMDPSVRDSGSTKCLTDLMGQLLWLLVGDKASAPRYVAVMDAMLGDNEASKAQQGGASKAQQVIGIAVECYIEIAFGANEPFGMPAKEAQVVGGFLDSAIKLLAAMRPKGVEAASDPTSRRFMEQVAPHLEELLELVHKYKPSINILEACTKNGLFGVLDTNAAKHVVATTLKVMEAEPGSRQSEKAACLLVGAPAEVVRQFAGKAPELVTKLGRVSQLNVPRFKAFVAFLLVACKDTHEALHASEALMTYLERPTVFMLRTANLDSLVKLAKAIESCIPLVEGGGGGGGGEVAPDMKDRLVEWCRRCVRTRDNIPAQLLKFLTTLVSKPSKRKAVIKDEPPAKRSNKDDK